MSCRIIQLPSLLECKMFNFDTTGSSTTVINDGKCLGTINPDGNYMNFRPNLCDTKIHPLDGQNDC